MVRLSQTLPSKSHMIIFTPGAPDVNGAEASGRASPGVRAAARFSWLTCLSVRRSFCATASWSRWASCMSFSCAATSTSLRRTRACTMYSLPSMTSSSRNAPAAMPPGTSSRAQLRPMNGAMPVSCTRCTVESKR
eukprot:scaffold870_cov268-Pinguiococcus_pyrenoidosus.AAC.23